MIYLLAEICKIPMTGRVDVETVLASQSW